MVYALERILPVPKCQVINNNGNINKHVICNALILHVQ